MIPEVSVVMSVYNGERYVGEAIESILDQTFRAFEFVIIDDASTDNSREFLVEYAARDDRIVLLRNEKNMGLAKSLNRGLRVARGQFIARQDADDVSLPDRLAIQVGYLRNKLHVGLLGSAYELVDSRGRCVTTKRLPLTDTEIRWRMLFHNPFSHTSVVFRRQLVDGEKHAYSEDLLCAQDYDLWTRLLTRTTGANIERSLVQFRIHDNSITATLRTEQDRVASMIAAREINELVPTHQIGKLEADILRQWYYEFPKRWSKVDMALGRIFLEILDEFGKQQNLDRDVLGRLHRYWIDRILSAIPPQQLSDLWASGLLLSLFRDHSAYVLMHFSKRATRRALRMLGRQKVARDVAG